MLKAEAAVTVENRVKSSGLATDLSDSGQIERAILNGKWRLQLLFVFWLMFGCSVIANSQEAGNFLQSSERGDDDVISILACSRLVNDIISMHLVYVYIHLNWPGWYAWRPIGPGGVWPVSDQLIIT